MKYLLPLLFLLLVGCDKTTHDIMWKRVIPAERRAEAADWIVKVTMPMGAADKDPEDRLAQAETTALTLFGKSVVGIVSNYTFVPYEDTTGPAREALDEYLKKAEKP